MEALSILELVFCAVVIVFAYSIRNATGFGGATVGVPFLTLVAPISASITIFAILNIMASYDVLRRDWRRIAWSEVLRLLPTSVVGVIFGLYLMRDVDEELISRALGAFIVVYAIYALATSAHPFKMPLRLKTFLAITMGWMGGFIGTLFGAAASPIYAIYMNMLALDKAVFRVTITTVISMGLVLRTLGYSGLGFMNNSVAIALAVAIPLMFFGGWVGDKLLKNINQKQFNQLVAGVLIISGVSLMLK